MELIIWFVLLTFLAMIIKDFLTYVSVRQSMEEVNTEPVGKKTLLVKLEEVPYKDMLVYLLYTADKQKFLGQDLDKQRSIPGFPIGSDEDIIALSNPPHYTACPNPFIDDFIKQNGSQYDAKSDKYDIKPTSKPTRSVKIAAIDHPRVVIDPKRLTNHIPSLDTGSGTTAKKAAQQYTGDAMLGIGQLHKSNAVPIFKAEDAVDISKMRRN